MPFLTNDPLPQCLQTSSDIALSPPIGNRRGCGRYLLKVKCLPFSSSAKSLWCALRVPTLFFSTLTRQSSAMTKVRINYDGWLALPAAMRQRFGLTTGDQLELELSDGGIVLRPVRSGPAAERPAPEPVTTAEPPVSVAPELPAAAAAAPIVKRGPGRPRKTPLPVVPPTLKARGGRRKAAATAEPGR